MPDTPFGLTFAFVSPEPDPIDRLIVVGDRVLIAPDEGETRSDVGLYLPQWAVEKQSVQAGRIVARGPGMPLPEPGSMEEEPWKQVEGGAVRYVPMQAEVGDYAIFLRKASVEIRFAGKTYRIVPQGAILLLDRSPPESDPDRPYPESTFDDEPSDEDDLYDDEGRLL